MSGGSSWKVAYADFVTALMAFFLLMWIMAAAKEETKAGLATYFIEGGRATSGEYMPGGDAELVVPIEFIQSQSSNISLSEEEITNEAIADQLTRFMLDTGMPVNSNGLAINSTGVLMTLTSGVMFEPGSVTLSALGYQALDQVIVILGKHQVGLNIRGHTSSDENGAPDFPSKWELASARATVCLRYILEHSQINPSYIRATAYADTSPRFPESDPASQSFNRRVEFYFFSRNLAADLRNF